MSSRDSLTYDFFNKHSVAKKDRQGRAYTHTFLTGGSFIVSNHEEVTENMFNAIERDMRSGVPIFINEIASPVFRMFLDLDFQLPERLNDAEIGSFVHACYTAFKRFYVSDSSVRNPRLFETIVLTSESPALCHNRQRLSELIDLQPEFSYTDVVKVDSIGNVASHRDGMMRPVEWIALPAPAGTYQCSIDNDIVSLLTAAKHQFRNRRVRNPALHVVERTGEIPAGAVDVSLEKEKIGPWCHSSNTIFNLDETTYFVNTKRDDAGMLKHGLHFIFPEMAVTIEQALYMREALIEHLTSIHGNNYAPLGWAQVVDNAVYGTGKGLRMMGSNKTSMCMRCKGQKGDVVCQSCIRGKIDEGRPYLLHSVFTDGVRNVDMEAHYGKALGYVLRRCSIRTSMTLPTPGWECYSGCPKFGNMLETVVKDGETTHKIVSKEALFKTDGRLKRGRGNMTNIEDPQIKTLFQEKIRKRFVTQYSQLRVVSVTKSDKGFYFIAVAGEGQHFCLNKMPPSDHTSNTIYFQCDREGLCVRCHCPKPTTANRSKGMCKDYKSSYISLDHKDVAILFPDQLTIKVSGRTYLELPNTTASEITQAQLTKK